MFVKTLNLGGAGPAVAIKDSIDVAGVPTRAGCRALYCGAVKNGFLRILIDLSRKFCWHVMCVYLFMANAIKGLTACCQTASAVRTGEFFWKIT